MDNPEWFQEAIEEFEADDEVQKLHLLPHESGGWYDPGRDEVMSKDQTARRVAAMFKQQEEVPRDASDRVQEVRQEQALRDLRSRIQEAQMEEGEGDYPGGEYCCVEGHCFPTGEALGGHVSQTGHDVPEEVQEMMDEGGEASAVATEIGGVEEEKAGVIRDYLSVMEEEGESGIWRAGDDDTLWEMHENGLVGDDRALLFYDHGDDSFLLGAVYGEPAEDVISIEGYEGQSIEVTEERGLEDPDLSLVGIAQEEFPGVLLSYQDLPFNTNIFEPPEIGVEDDRVLLTDPDGDEHVFSAEDPADARAIAADLEVLSAPEQHEFINEHAEPLKYAGMVPLEEYDLATKDWIRDPDIDPQLTEDLYERGIIGGVNADEMEIVYTEDGTPLFAQNVDVPGMGYAAVTNARVIDELTTHPGVFVPAVYFDEDEQRTYMEEVPGEAPADLSHTGDPGADYFYDDEAHGRAMEAFLDAAAARYIAGDWDGHTQNWHITPEGDVFPIDLDYSGYAFGSTKDLSGEDVRRERASRPIGNLANAWRRIHGNVGRSMAEQDIKEAIRERAEQWDLDHVREMVPNIQTGRGIINNIEGLEEGRLP